MGISYDVVTETITVTGGTWESPHRAQDIDDDPTAGNYVSAGGYGGRVFTLSANLVIGSAEDETFFDLVGSVLTCADGYTMTIYSAALRGGKSTDTWAARTFGSCTPVTSSEAKKMATTGILKAYVEKVGILCELQGNAIDKGLSPLASVSSQGGCQTGSPWGGYANSYYAGPCPVCMPPCPLPVVQLPPPPVEEVIPVEQVIPLQEVVPSEEMIPVRQAVPSREVTPLTGLDYASEIQHGVQPRNRVVFVFADQEVLR